MSEPCGGERERETALMVHVVLAKVFMVYGVNFLMSYVP